MIMYTLLVSGNALIYMYIHNAIEHFLQPVIQFDYLHPYISQQHIKANAYTKLVRPQVEYAAVVCDPYTQENQHKIEMVQRSAAAWYVCNNYTRDVSVITMLHQPGWRSLLQRQLTFTWCSCTNASMES